MCDRSNVNRLIKIGLSWLAVFLFTSARANDDVSEMVRRVRDHLNPIRHAWIAAMAPFQLQAKVFAEKINELQKDGKSTACAMQLNRELLWRIHFSGDVEAAARLSERLRVLLESGIDQSFAEHPSAHDGGWGVCHEEEFMRLYATKDALNNMKEPRAPYRLSLLDKYNSPEALIWYLKTAVINDVKKDGEIKRVRLDDIVSSLGRLILTDTPADYPFHPDLKLAYLKFVDDFWQNPTTGMWGQWYVLPGGDILKVDDAVLSFKLIHQRKGQVRQLSKVAMRILDLKDVNFPLGYKVSGKYENHLNWSVAVVFRYAWPLLDEEMRQRVRFEIEAMLEWCLGDSLQRDGGFKTSTIDTTVAEALEFGILFLSDIGYFKKEKRFWTNREFPNATFTKELIRKKVESLGHGPLVQRLLKEL